MSVPPELIRRLRLASLMLLAGLALPASVLAVTASGANPGVTRIGTNGPDRLRGTPRNDRLYGRGGKDLLTGFDGADLLSGGPGSDRLLGGAGNDSVQARDGTQDSINCGPGKDTAVVDNIDVVRSCKRVRRPTAKTGTLRHPIPIGAPAALGGGWRLRVVRATPNATERILAWDSSNNPPARRHQFFMVEVAAVRTGRKPAYLHAGFRFRAVGRSKKEYSTFADSCGLLPDPDLEIVDRKIFHRGKVRGNICWEVRRRDARSLVMFSNGGRAGGRLIYFALR